MSYVYRHVEVVRVLDGDTVELKVDLGAKITWQDKFRLYGIDTPERGTTGALEAEMRLKALVADGIARIETFRADKYGRYLVDIWVPTGGGELHVNRVLVVDGYAREYFGGKK